MDPKIQDLVTNVTAKLEGWAEGFAAMLPNLAVALLVVIVFGVVARVSARLARASLDRVSSNQQINGLLVTSLRISVVVVGLFIALGVLKLDKTVTSLLAGIGVVGLALGFAFQDIAANFMSGIIMALRRPFEVGDLVETHAHLGTVERVTLRATVLRVFTGQLVIIPNKEVLQNPIVNYTQSGERRVDLDVGVSYGDDLERAKQVAVAAVEKLDCRDSSRDVELYYTGFGGSSIDFSIRFWLDLKASQPNYLEARSRAIVAIKKAFDENGITIPFPIRTLDFGVVGGERLDEVLPGLRGGNRSAGSPSASASS